ncbi:MAG: radical SAM protein [Candidatus Omnitrophica bacterium]|nr:radical SAM protein [Candidatus Omnitrophota bacterium]MDD5352414.1 radical SAM protein [Candidatus Omnitrophota bacterium]MDD5550012.1 radical SAM protein [Candidatus Omnitrophota bacterium]
MRVLLVVYDNESYIHDFPMGLAYIASVLRKEGIEVEIYSQDFNHYPDEHLTEYLNKNKFDVVGVSIIGGYFQYRKLLSLSTAINNSKNRPFYVIGGHGPAPEPEYFIKKTGADAVVIGEGEITILNLMDSLSKHKSLSKVKGIAYRDGNKVVINERQPLIEDVDSIARPAYELFPMEYYRLLRMPHCETTDFVMRLLSGRGCPFNCNFCYRMDEGFRPRKNEAIIEEIKLLQKDYGITYIAFGDELLMSSIARTEELCRDFIRANLKIKWSCNGRLNYAREDVLRLMKESGCVFINYGIEAMDDQILKNMNKTLTTKQIISGIEATLKIGISPGYNIIFGNIGETRETLEKGVEFLLKYDDGAQVRTIRPVTPYPGSPLYYYAIKKGLLKDCEDFYENKHVNSDLLSVNFTNMSDDEFHRCLLQANTRLLRNYFQKKIKSMFNQTKDLYLHKNRDFRGFRQT